MTSSTPNTALTVLITGANRGLGLGLVRRYLQQEWRVLATCRSPDKAQELGQILAAHGQVAPLKCDVASDDSVERCAKEVAKHVDSLDLLINNAGVSNPEHPFEDPSKVIRSEFMDVMNVNVAGVVKATQEFLPLLLKSTSSEDNFPKVANISSSMGSIELTNNVKATSYRCSKAALNMSAKCFSLEFPQVVFVGLHPGHMKTDMGQSKGREAPVEVEDAAEGIYGVVKDAGPQDSGVMIDYKGNRMPY